MNIKALGLAAIVAVSAPLSAQAATISGFDSDGTNVFSTGNNAGVAGLALNAGLSQLFVSGVVAQGAQNVAISYVVGNNAPAAPIRITILPQPDGIKDLVLSFELNGDSIGGPFVLSDATGNGTALALGPQPQITLSLGGVVGDVFTVLTSFSGVTKNGDGFNLGVQAVPLPATALLFLSALGGLGFLSRRKAA